MGKKKTEEVRVTTEVDGREVDITDRINAVGEKDRDAIREQHDELLNRLASLEQQKEFYTSRAGDEFCERLIKHLKERIRECERENVTPGVGGETSKTNIGRVAMAEEIVELIEGTSFGDEIRKAEAELKQFERDNELLLYSSPEPVESAQA